MSTPRPRATLGCPEDAHTPAKSHTLLLLLMQTRAMGHTSQATNKKKKNVLALLVSFPCCCGCFSFGVLCCPCFVAVLWRPRSRLCCVLAFCGSTLFFLGANPRTGLSSSFQVSPPSLPYAVGMQYGRGVYIYWVLLALILFSRFTLEVQPTFQWSAAEISVSTVALMGLSAAGSRYGRFGSGALLQITQSCVARQNLSFIIECETPLLRCTLQVPHPVCTTREHSWIIRPLKFDRVRTFHGREHRHF